MTIHLTRQYQLHFPSMTLKSQGSHLTNDQSLFIGHVSARAIEEGFSNFLCCLCDTSIFKVSRNYEGFDWWRHFDVVLKCDLKISRHHVPMWHHNDVQKLWGQTFKETERNNRNWDQISMPTNHLKLKLNQRNLF